ncbi:SDR family oxidoreductase [Acinetobacter pittii]|uniref:SDR family oxidoreductase n=1 Tax=Acinetobacter pittii TaxID=48296 RepID=UPI0029FFB3D5|nr:SDR family oxidoreductase [Acinetobacter pittii]MDX8237967.1 SDR family oxidoreductase [Acinetobacter pittii]
MRLKDKVVIITGAASGIGFAIAQKFFEEGANLILLDKHPMEKQAVGILSNSQQYIELCKLDVGCEKDWVEFTSQLELKNINKVDVLVNNAGIAIEGNAEDILEKNLDLEINVNLKGPIFGTKHILPFFGNSGSIINISSIEGIVGNADYLAYCATKGAVRNLTKSTALYLGDTKKNIRINSIHPGYVRTSMIGDDIQKYIPLHPINRIGEPKDIAFAALFLASDESTFVHGSEIVVDGGFLAR